MQAVKVIESLNGWNKPAEIVSEADLPTLLNQNGTGCDCKGCDKD